MSRPSSSSPSTEGGNPSTTYDLPKGLENYYKVMPQREKLAWMKRFVESRTKGNSKGIRDER